MIRPLDDLWGEIARDPGASTFRRVDDTHPFDLYVGVDPGGAKVLLLLTAAEPPPVTVAPRGLQIEKGRRADGRWALTVSLRMPELETLFSRLCEDLVAASRTGCPPSGAGRFVIDRIARWARLLARGHKSGLGEQEYRGLLAELVVLQRLLIPAVGPIAAIAGWTGPLEANQDFRLSDRLLEVKSTVIGSLVVTISSAEQLDVHDFPLFLVAVPVGDGAGGADGTLNDFIQTIRDAASADSATLSTFEELLAMSGYDPADERAEREVSIGLIRKFKVAPEFPRIVRSQLPAAIRAVGYQLDLGLCGANEVERIFR